MSFDGSPIIVTGATGFLGKHLAEHLDAVGARVHCVVRSSSALNHLPSRVTVERHDGSTESLCSIFRAVRPVMAFHLAARFVPTHATSDIHPLITDNVLFSTQLFEAAASAPPCCVVNAGTAWQHTMEHPNLPVNLYAATKQAVEDLLYYYAGTGRLRALTLKLFDTYGPRDNRRKLFSALEDAAATQAPLLMSPGEQILDLLHVHDAVRGFIAAAERLLAQRAEVYEAFALSGPRRHTLREVVQLYQEVTGSKLRVVWGGRPYRDNEVMVPWEGPRLPGWEPHVDLRQGLASLRTV